MTKQDCIWVAIRVFGIYFLLLAVKTVPQLIDSILTWNVLSDVDSDLAALNIVKESGGARALGSIVQFIIYTMVGVYLVRGANGLYRIICGNEIDT